MVVVDTNVVSEMMRVEAAPRVLDWFAATGTDQVFLTTVTMAEIEYGIEMLPDGRRKSGLRSQAESAFDTFADRLLAFDALAAKQYSHVMTSRQRRGRPIAVLDAQIAAVCLSRGAILATRNVRDFAGVGIELVNPWEFDADAG